MTATPKPPPRSMNAPTQQSIAMPPEDAYYDQGFVQPHTAARARVPGFPVTEVDVLPFAVRRCGGNRAYNLPTNVDRKFFR
jgi:hypothetical protein